MKRRQCASLVILLCFLLLSTAAYVGSFHFLRYDVTFTYFEHGAEGGFRFRVIHVVYWSRRDWLNEVRYVAYYPLQCAIGTSIEDYPYDSPYEKIRHLDRGEPVFVRRLQSLRNANAAGLTD